jgi:hypothetical protein
MENKGVEYRISASLLQTNNYAFDISFTGSYNKNTITSLGPVPVTSPFQANQPGRPFQSQYKRKYVYNDANGDGYLATTEVTVFGPDSTFFLGPSQAPLQQTLTAGAEAFGRRLRVQAMFDRRAGGYLTNLQADGFLCIVGPPVRGCKGLNFLGATLEEQARAIALRFYNAPGAFTEPTDFIKLRELSVSWNLGDRLANRLLRASGARITVSGRNLATWLDGWSGFDPEGTQSRGDDITVTENFALGTTRYMMARLNLTF